ncbi:DNA-directed RNA polymerase I subunit RPA34.5-domain-containing protein [Phyllosticta citribraziliensis]|uniref:DNA-directed RNA polymerase I subunit RPA34.5-domain-containing protein n=1 Tax=Phyllosticta citribraziliensis TaxID=989973 RepID=A0ABR1L3K2_9PEZI
MSKKVKETRVPIPGETPKSAAKEPKKDKKKSKPVAKVEPSPSPSESDSESTSEASFEDESSEEKVSKEKSSTGKSAPAKTSSESSESESSSAESESGSESESSEEEAPRDVQTVSLRPAKAFQPPPGFKKVPSNINPASNLSKLLKSTDLSKKQIWHITAPASVDVKAVKEIALGQGMENKTVLQHKGAEYAFARESDDGQTSGKLLVPTEKGYAAIPDDFSQTLHLKQVVRLPAVSEKQEESTQDAMKFVIRPEKPARPQPEGLRMRYRPAGNADAPEKPKAKRRHEKTGGDEETAEVKPKKKKKSKRESAGEAMDGVEMTGVKEEDGEKKKKKKEKKKA